jgi:hypothetical protein
MSPDTVLVDEAARSLFRPGHTQATRAQHPAAATAGTFAWLSETRMDRGLRNF